MDNLFNRNQANQYKIYQENAIAARSVVELADIVNDFQAGASLIRKARDIPADLLNLIRGA